MTWADLHAIILRRAFKNVLGEAEVGAIAFVRCLTPDVASSLAADANFTLPGWEIWRVAGEDNASMRTIKADRAVEMREAKEKPTLLLVDTLRAGAGMDGIYSAAREVDEATLFKEALALAGREISRNLSREQRQYAEKAVKKARGYGNRFSISLWNEFDFFIRIAAAKESPGTLLYLLGLWPVEQSQGQDGEDGLDISRMFVERLLGSAASGFTPVRRIQALRLLNPSEDQMRDLEYFLWSAATKPLLSSLADLVDKPHLWVNTLRLEGPAQVIQSLEITPWQTRTRKLAKWSGLVEEGAPEEPPVFILKPDAENSGEYSKLEVRWKARPESLEKGAVEYRVAMMTDMDEEITSKELMHSAKKEEKCRFSNDDFTTLSEDALICAKIFISVVGSDSVEPQETDEFIIRFGQPPTQESAGLGRKIRTFSEGMIELEDRDKAAAIASSTVSLTSDAKGFLLLRTRQRGKSFRVFQPSLIREVEQQWIEQAGSIGRWRVKIRASGARANIVEFLPFNQPPSVPEPIWDRAAKASRLMAERFVSCGGSIGQIYDEKAKHYETVKEYLLAWSILIEEGHPLPALANTVEVQSLSGRTIGLIVLPSYPLRVCWHVAYDNLVLHSAFQQGLAPKEIREELAFLDSAMFPAILPGLDEHSSFVFGDTLGFHVVGMIPDSDKEPKAALALLARALGESETADTAPTVGKESSQILGNEISKYIDCHAPSKLLHVHALRPGDGLTVARSLGSVQRRYMNASQDEEMEEAGWRGAPAFVLELYPSEEQRGVAGRFIVETREKRRSGAGVVPEDDHWMLESLSLPGGVTLPRLRWARKRDQGPKTPAHLAIAFDTFESKVVCDGGEQAARSRPFYVYGMLSFFEREFTTVPSPRWRSLILPASDGEKHPSDRMHTDRLSRLQQGILKCVASNLNAQGGNPTLRTEISADRAQHLKTLHGLCDWVITLDRNAGIEYFDSPLDNKEIYDAYVIDCVPEREDLGCLQLITTTSNLDEVRELLDGALDQMGLSRSLRNAQFLLEHLKALSGRLAIRLTGRKAPTSELIALALCHALCWESSENDDCWVSLKNGFFIPVDDVQDLLPPLIATEKGENEKAVRPDLIYVSLLPRKGLLFRFIEVKYRRHLRAARNPSELNRIREQTQSLRKRWQTWYSQDGTCPTFRAIRRAKLGACAAVLCRQGAQTLPST